MVLPDIIIEKERYLLIRVLPYDGHHVPHLVVEGGAGQHHLQVELESCLVGQEVVVEFCVSKKRARAGGDRGREELVDVTEMYILGYDGIVRGEGVREERTVASLAMARQLSFQQYLCSLICIFPLLHDYSLFTSWLVERPGIRKLQQPPDQNLVPCIEENSL